MKLRDLHKVNKKARALKRVTSNYERLNRLPAVRKSRLDEIWVLMINHRHDLRELGVEL